MGVTGRDNDTYIDTYTQLVTIMNISSADMAPLKVQREAKSRLFNDLNAFGGLEA